MKNLGSPEDQGKGEDSGKVEDEFFLKSLLGKGTRDKTPLQLRPGNTSPVIPPAFPNLYGD